MANASYLVGIDIGTTGAKTVVFDPAGVAVASGYREYTCTYPKPNWVEQDARLLVASSMQSCAEAMRTSGVDPAAEVFCDIYEGLSAQVFDKLAQIQERY